MLQFVTECYSYSHLHSFVYIISCLISLNIVLWRVTRGFVADTPICLTCVLFSCTLILYINIHILKLHCSICAIVYAIRFCYCCDYSYTKCEISFHLYDSFDIGVTNHCKTVWYTEVFETPLSFPFKITFIAYRSWIAWRNTWKKETICKSRIGFIVSTPSTLWQSHRTCILSFNPSAYHIDSFEPGTIRILSPPPFSCD